MGGVAYLSLEDTEVCFDLSSTTLQDLVKTGTIPKWHQVPCNATHEAIPRYGAVIWWREDSGRSGFIICSSQVSQNHHCFVH